MKLEKLSIFAILSVIFILFLINCGKNKNPVQSNLEFTIDQFPMQVGAQWEYYVLDSLIDCAPIFGCIDSATVTILDSVPSMIEGANEHWLFDFRGEQKVVTQTVRIDEVELLWSNYVLRFPLEFPMKVGDSWPNNAGWSIFDTDSIFVVDQRNIVTPSGSYNNAYYLTGEVHGCEESATFNIWIVPYVGIVKIEYSALATGFEGKHSWSLKSYNPNNQIEPFTVDKFPNNDWISWTYEIYDALSSIYDTVIVQVAESATVAIWNYDFGDSSYTELVSVEGDTVKFITTGSISYTRNSLLFPLVSGKSWVTYPLGYVSTVMSITNLLTPAGQFYPTYKIETAENCGAECSHIESVWYVPNVGIVQKQIDRSDVDDQMNLIIIQDEQWRLLDYNFRE